MHRYADFQEALASLQTKVQENKDGITGKRTEKVRAYHLIQMLILH